MPIEPKFGELDFRRIERGRRRMAKKTDSADWDADRQSNYSNRKEVRLI